MLPPKVTETARLSPHCQTALSPPPDAAPNPRR